MKKIKKQKFPKRNILSIVAVIVLLIAIGLYWHYRTDQKNPSAQTTANQAANPYASDSKATANPTVVPNATANPNPNVPGGSTGSTNGTEATLTAPSGSFVSNHGSSQQPVTASTTEASTCITTAGATCEIRFIQGDTTETLSATQATASKDSQNGTTTWTWTPAQLGLGAGPWRITAVSTLNGQSKSTSDQVNLTIGS